MANRQILLRLLSLLRSGGELPCKLRSTVSQVSHGALEEGGSVCLQQKQVGRLHSPQASTSHPKVPLGSKLKIAPSVEDAGSLWARSAAQPARGFCTNALKEGDAAGKAKAAEIRSRRTKPPGREKAGSRSDPAQLPAGRSKKKSIKSGEEGVLRPGVERDNSAAKLKSSSGKGKTEEKQKVRSQKADPASGASTGDVVVKNVKPSERKGRKKVEQAIAAGEGGTVATEKGEAFAVWQLPENFTRPVRHHHPSPKARLDTKVPKERAPLDLRASPENRSAVRAAGGGEADAADERKMQETAISTDLDGRQVPEVLKGSVLDSIFPGFSEGTPKESVQGRMLHESVAVHATSGNRGDVGQKDVEDGGLKEGMEGQRPAAEPRELPRAQDLYAVLLTNERQGRKAASTQAEKHTLMGVLNRFAQRGWAADQALALYVNHATFPTVAKRLRKLIQRGLTEDLRDRLLFLGPSDKAEAELFPLFAELCVREFAPEMQAFKDLTETADMTKPHMWYPAARLMKRRIIYHSGPTNSGKTYEALQALKAAESGVYCGPLRLLAMEIYDTLNAAGTYCNLHTGQERKHMPFANHTACTVEMANLSKPVQVAVVDEIQMIGDEYRGWAWTRALMGLQAQEIHLCGDSSALSVVEILAQFMGDELETREYQRWKPLTVMDKSLGGKWNAIEAGDCIVAFSRKEIFQIKKQVEVFSKQKCCVIYGALPPETRRQQARLFNDENSGFDVLVASDAVGMGLNLNIKRIVFNTLEKYMGDTTRAIPISTIKQIAGRAGRRNSPHPEGLVTTLMPTDLPVLRRAMKGIIPTAAGAGLFPVFEQVELFAGQLPETPFSKLLDRFAETSRVDGHYFLCKHDQLKRIAQLLEPVQGLSLRDRFSFCMAPVQTRDGAAMGKLQRWAEDYGSARPVKLDIQPKGSIQLLESKHQILTMYLWLSWEFGMDAFPDRYLAEERAVAVVELLARQLEETANAPEHSYRALLGRHAIKPALDWKHDAEEVLFQRRRGVGRSRGGKEGRRRVGLAQVLDDSVEGLFSRQRAREKSSKNVAFAAA